MASHVFSARFMDDPYFAKEPQDCTDCGGTGYAVHVVPDCCGRVHDLGYCAGDCAVPREITEPCQTCGGSGVIPADDTKG
jgi:DnaJ-class molecular chaperone